MSPRIKRGWGSRGHAAGFLISRAGIPSAPHPPPTQAGEAGVESRHDLGTAWPPAGALPLGCLDLSHASVLMSLCPRLAVPVSQSWAWLLCGGGNDVPAVRIAARTHPACSQPGRGKHKLQIWGHTKLGMQDDRRKRNVLHIIGVPTVNGLNAPIARQTIKFSHKLLKSDMGKTKGPRKFKNNGKRYTRQVHDGKSNTTLKRTSKIILW